MVRDPEKLNSFERNNKLEDEGFDDKNEMQDKVNEWVG